MKKSLALLVCTTVLAGMLAGCGSDPAPAATPETPAVEEGADAPEAEEGADAPEADQHPIRNGSLQPIPYSNLLSIQTKITSLLVSTLISLQQLQRIRALSMNCRA